MWKSGSKSDRLRDVSACVVTTGEFLRLLRNVDTGKRKENEKKFRSWIETANGGRRYSYEVQGRYGWKARYFKEVDSEEVTVAFWQEIYNDKGKLVEVHHKYPNDLGHTHLENE